MDSKYSNWLCVLSRLYRLGICCYLLLLPCIAYSAAPVFALEGEERDLVTLLYQEGFVPSSWHHQPVCVEQPLVGDWRWYGYPGLGQVQLHVRRTTTPGRFAVAAQIGLLCDSQQLYGAYSFDPLDALKQLSQRHLGHWSHGSPPTFHLQATRASIQRQWDQAERPLPIPLVAGPSISQLWRSEHAWPCVALTFDACSTFGSAQVDSQLLTELVRLNMPATVFLGGLWALKYPMWVQWLAAHDLFEIGTHGYSHQHSTAITLERLWLELAMTQKILFETTGKWPTLFRPPYGEIGDDEVTIASQLGMATIQYDVTAGDADKGLSATRMAEWIGSQVRPGSIVVLHMNRPGGHTAAALPLLLQALNRRHLKPCHVSQLLTSFWHHAACGASSPWDRGAVCQSPAAANLLMPPNASAGSVFRRK